MLRLALLVVLLSGDAGTPALSTLSGFAKAWSDNQVKAEAKWFGGLARFLVRAGKVSKAPNGQPSMIVGAVEPGGMAPVMLSCDVSDADAMQLEVDQLVVVEGRFEKADWVVFGKGWNFAGCKLTLKPSAAEIRAACARAPPRSAECTKP